MQPGHTVQVGQTILVDGVPYTVTGAEAHKITYGPVTHAPVIEEYYTLTDKELHYVGPPNGPTFTMAELLAFIIKETVAQTQEKLLHGQTESHGPGPQGTPSAGV